MRYTEKEVKKTTTTTTTTTTNNNNNKNNNVKCGLGQPDWPVSIFDTYLRKPLWVYCPGRVAVSGNDRADTLARGKAIVTSGFRLGRSEVLRSLRHYMQAESKDITPGVAWRRER